MAAKPIFKPSWMDSLRQALSQNPERIAVLGIGNVLCGDDAVGALAAQRLSGLIHDERILIVDGGAAPENCTGALRRFQPDWLLMIDAAELRMPPGSIEWLEWQHTAGLSASTHILPIHILLQYLGFELDCQTTLIGIQPRSTTFDTPISPEVDTALHDLVEALADELVRVCCLSS